MRQPPSRSWCAISLDTAPDARLALGANGGPPLDEEDAIDPRCAQIAWTALQCICIIAKTDAYATQVKKAGGEYYSVRNLWLWAMKPHIPNNQLARIAKLNRKTVTGYIQQVDRHASRNGLLNCFTEMIADLVEPIPGLVDDASEAIADMAVEAALDRVRKAVDVLGR